jgi:aryl-alcohol dehydrogenase-like predicted oxidoreductase
VYGDGESSRAVGEWLARSGKRDEFTLLVKGCHPPYCEPALVQQEVDHARSLLGVDALDVFILHRDDSAIPVERWADPLLAAVEREAIRSFGVSNWTLARFHQLRAVLGAEASKLAIFSNHFSLAEMVTPTWPGCLAMTREDVAEVAATGTAPLAWAALAGGYFAGRDIPSWRSEPNDRRRKRATVLAERLGVSTPAVALAYLLQQSQEMLAAIGTRSPKHLYELLAATALDLSPDDLAWLEST